MIIGIRSPIGIVVVAVIVFATVFATASSLTVRPKKVPVSGSQATVACDTDGVPVGYTISGLNVTQIVVTDDDCATGTITLATTAGYTFVGGPTKPNAPTVTYTLGPVGGPATPIPLLVFNPGTTTVTLIP